jgi:PleD family two-component response regulator
MRLPACCWGQHGCERSVYYMTIGKKKIVAILSDLMFIVKIQEAAKRAGLEVVFVKTQDDALTQAKENPAVIILDLNTTSLDVLEVISKLKADEETSKINVLGYVSHVQGELKQAAYDKGCDTVIARSAFSQNLPTILRRYA